MQLISDYQVAINFKNFQIIYNYQIIILTFQQPFINFINYIYSTLRKNRKNVKLYLSKSNLEFYLSKADFF